MIAKDAPRPPETGPDPFADDAETMRDIRTCEALHEARAAFHDALVEGSAVQDRHFAAQLRQEPPYQMAEFFFLLRAFRLDSEEKVRRYAELHNRHLEQLQADREKMRRLGLSPTRVRKGMFSPESIPKLVENYRAGDGAIDQSDLSRLLIEVMSPETCRKTAVTLTDAGYLERRRSWGPVTILEWMEAARSGSNSSTDSRLTERMLSSRSNNRCFSRTRVTRRAMVWSRRWRSVCAGESPWCKRSRSSSNV